MIKLSSFRPGGASFLFHEWDEDVRRLQWRGRWASTRMLEHYIQELQSYQLLTQLSADARCLVDQLSDLFDASLAEATPW